MAASIRTGWAMTRSARLGSRRWALRWCGCGITSSLRIGTRRGSGSWRGLRGGGGRWWVAGFVGVGWMVAAGPPVAFPPSPQPSPSRERGSEGERPHPGAVPRGRGGKRGWRLGRGCSSALTPALSLAGEGVGGGGALAPALSLAGEGVGGGGGCAAGCSSALTPTPSPSRERGSEGEAPSARRCPSRERGEDCPSCCVLLTSCATLMSSRTRGVISSYASGIPT